MDSERVRKRESEVNGGDSYGKMNKKRKRREKEGGERKNSTTSEKDRDRN